MHADITQLKKGIERILKQQYNPAGGDHGMLAILALNNYRQKANKTITTADVINMSKKEAEAESTKTDTTVHPKITSRADAQEEAKRLNTTTKLSLEPRRASSKHSLHLSAPISPTQSYAKPMEISKDWTSTPSMNY